MKKTIVAIAVALILALGVVGLVNMANPSNVEVAIDPPNM